jgi:hypothetical protein
LRSRRIKKGSDPWQGKRRGPGMDIFDAGYEFHFSLLTIIIAHFSKVSTFRGKIRKKIFFFILYFLTYKYTTLF